jgi:hypothetical protein
MPRDDVRTPESIDALSVEADLPARDGGQVCETVRGRHLLYPAARGRAQLTPR